MQRPPAQIASNDFAPLTPRLRGESDLSPNQDPPKLGAGGAGRGYEQVGAMTWTLMNRWRTLSEMQ